MANHIENYITIENSFETKEGEWEAPLFTASQINRSGADDIITGTKIAGSFSKLMTADFVVSLSRK